MPDVPRHVDPQEHRVARVDRRNLVARDEVPLPVGKHDRLLPARSRLLAGGGSLVLVALLYADEVFASDRARVQLFRLRADLRAFDGPFGDLAMHRVVEFVRQISHELLSVGLVAAGLQNPVHDIEPEARVAKSGLPVEQRAGRDAGDIALLSDDGFQRRRADTNLGIRGRDGDLGPGLAAARHDAKESNSEEVGDHGDSVCSGPRRIQAGLRSAGTEPVFASRNALPGRWKMVERIAGTIAGTFGDFGL
jgi:hypothetical protein